MFGPGARPAVRPGEEQGIIMPRVRAARAEAIFSAKNRRMERSDRSPPGSRKTAMRFMC